jgi:hypothetical protein
VSVVPFAATINIGSAHANWLVGGAINQTPYSPSQWLGCVMARTAKLKLDTNIPEAIE